MSRRPRVLGACDYLAKYAAGLADGLAAAGAVSGLLTRDHDGEFGARPGGLAEYMATALGPGTTHIVLPGRPREAGALPRALRAARAARRFAPDVVHLQSSVATDPRLPFVAGARRGRYALTVHDVTRHPGDRQPSHGRRAVEAALVRHAGLVFVHAEQLADDLHRRWGRVPTAVVPHGVDPPRPAPMPDRPAVLFFGRILPYKGLDVLLAALPRIWATLPELELHVAGSGALPSSPLLDDPRVRVDRGYVAEEELPARFAAATCVVLPYREASQSGVGAQAKRFGRGMVVTDVGGLPELVADGSGLVVAPEDPTALADAVLRVAAPGGLAAELGRAATAGQATDGWSRVAELTLEAYARAGLLDSGRSHPRRRASKTSE